MSSEIESDVKNIIMVSLDDKGRIVIPKRIRQNLDLSFGDSVVLLQVNGDLRLRKVTLDIFRREFR